MRLYEYGTEFFSYQQIGSLTSARAVVPLIISHLRPRTVMDVGCGAGAWVCAYSEGGADVIGVDAAYVRPDDLLFEEERFRAIDVSRPFHMGTVFDVAHCVEVAEHLDPAAGEVLVDNLTAHAKVVVFSAAPPGQGGEHHVNERDYEYWRDLFEARGYELFDFLRPAIRDLPGIEKWYRYNLFVYVRHDAVESLPPQVRATRVPSAFRVPDIAPLSWRLRRRLLSLLPVAVVDRLALFSHRLVLLKKRRPGVAA